ncbi:MAG: DNA polymerase III subunit delta [Pseudomonadota bacterium]
MKLRPDQLAAALKKGLAPVYVVSGDEPLLVEEAAALIRHALRAAGVAERQSFQADTGFKWSEWLASFDSLSLFAERRLIELRLPSGKPGVEGGKTLEAWCANPPADTWLLVLLPRLDRAGQNAKWFKALEAAGALVTVQPPSLEQLPAWIGERLARHGLKAERETLAWLAGRVEGNLLAAHQEVEKLALLLPPGPVSLDAAREAVVDVARYDASDLPEALLKGDAIRYCRILDGLKAEGEAPPLAVWLLANEVRNLYRLASGQARGDSLAALYAELRIWDSRQPLVGRALRRVTLAQLAQALRQVGLIDRAAKGLLREDAWELMKQLGLSLMGQRTVPMLTEVM